MKKVAILFGINDYQQCKLNNAVNDATALSTKLDELGFETRCILNPDFGTMRDSLINFKNLLSKSNVGLFFFAGHGIQCKGENFLTTIDTSFADESSCKYTAMPLKTVIDIFEDSGISTKIFILDACRDNPFVTWRGLASEGLAPVYAPKGTIIAFSTSPGQKAADGNNAHGVYTNALLTHIGTKKVPIEDMFKRVRNTVSSHTDHKQITWEHTSLMGTFCFNSGYDEGHLMTNYSENALADSNYVFEEDNAIQNIVTDLKSYSWYTQNPAINRINQFNIEMADKDDLFILGRNIYQSACGDSGNAVAWMENIENNLKRLQDNTAIHILNGILFEIYFDSNGDLRTQFKSDYYEDPVRLCQKEKYSPCCTFIASFLEQYPQRIIHIPGTTTTLNLDITIELNDLYLSDIYHIQNIFFDGLTCMYDDKGMELYRYDGNNSRSDEVTKKELESIIAYKIAVPVNKLRITYNSKINENNKIIVPDEFQLLRYV